MKVVAVIQVDLKHSPLGTASRLADDLQGVPVLTRTLRRASAARRLDEIVVTCPTEQHDQVRRLAADCRVSVLKFDGPPHAASNTVRVARKWALDSWRGGLGNTCFFDEHTHPALCLEIARQAQADAIVTLAAEAPLIDPKMIDDMVACFQEQIEMTKLVFAQAPPGLAATVFSPVLLEEVARAGMSPGWVNSYRPDQPQRDMINVPACFRPPLAVQTARGRLTSDTRRGFEQLRKLLTGANGDLGAVDVVRKLAQITANEPEPWPAEVQIELTTEDQLPDTLLRPRGKIVPQRGPLNVELLQRLLGDLCQYDDVLVVLGGFGEPLLHPDFAAILRHCREAGVFGLAVRTNGLAMEQKAIQAMLDFDVDVVQVFIDAADAAGYREVQGFDGWDTVVRNMTTFDRMRRDAGKINPVLAASLTKARETFGALEPFHAHWLKFSGWAVIEGYSHHAGLMADRRVMSMAPPQRLPCRQLANRCTILANGLVVGCDRDFQGGYVVGDLNEQSLSQIWHDDRMASLRAAHRRADYSIHPMCADCEDWHRP